MLFLRSNSKLKKKLFAGLVTLGLGPFLTGCATNTLGISHLRNDTICKTFVPISVSAADSKETQDQVLRHDAVWEELCG